MNDTSVPALRPDLFAQLAATDPYQGRARRLFERGQVIAVEGNQADVRVGYDARGNALELKQLPIVSGYVPAVGDWVSIQYEAGHSSAPWITGPSMAAGDVSDSAGIGVFPVREGEPPDPARSAIYFDASLGGWRGWDGAEWVDFSGKLHNSLPDLQGGAAGEYYHLTADEYAGLGGGSFPPTAVIYAGTDGRLTGDATKLSWTAAGLGVFCTPSYPLDVAGDVRVWRDGGYRILFLSVCSDTHNHCGQLACRKSRGSSASPTAVMAGDDLGFIALQQGYDGSTYYGGFQAYVETTEDWDSSHRGTRARFYQAYTGAAAITEFMRWEDGQIRMQSGSAAAPSLAGMSHPDQGLFWPGNSMLAVGLDGTERWRWSGNDVGMVAAGRIFLDGVACAGNSYIRERTGDVIALTAGGNDQFEVRATHQYGRPTSYDPTNDGEFNLETDDNALKHQVGSVVHRNGWCIYSSSPVEDTTGSGAERTLDSFTIPAAYWKVGKRVTIQATVLAEVAGNGKNVALRLKLGSTVVMEKTIAGASSPTWRSGHFDFEMTFVIGALAGAGVTIYPARTIRGFTSQSHADFNTIKSVATHELYPMEPDTPGLAVDTTAGQTVAVTQQTNSAGVSVHLRLQGLTIYAT
ncbi:MAG: hypothetical protein ACE149_16615 [Armatimonadota bacterium]